MRYSHYLSVLGLGGYFKAVGEGLSFNYERMISGGGYLIGETRKNGAGAVYLDQGYEAARKIVIDVFTPLLDVALNLSKKRDSKGRLQELMNGVVINYVVVSQTNINREDCHFVVEARLGKDILGRGEGHNIKEAEINAASDALSKKVGK